MQVQKIKFLNRDFILPEGNKESPIVTLEDYQAGECGYAHLYPDGQISRFGERVGTIDDIEFGDFIEIEVDIAEFVDGLMGDTWPSF